MKRKKIKVVKLKGQKGGSVFVDQASGENYMINNYYAFYYDGDQNSVPIIATPETEVRFIVVMHKKHTKAFRGYIDKTVADGDTIEPEELELKEGGMFMALWEDEMALELNLLVLRYKDEGFSHLLFRACSENGRDEEMLNIMRDVFEKYAKMVSMSCPEKPLLLYGADKMAE